MCRSDGWLFFSNIVKNISNQFSMYTKMKIKAIYLHIITGILIMRNEGCHPGKELIVTRVQLYYYKWVI